MALVLGVYALRSYLKLICEDELHSLPNKKVGGAKNHGKNHINVKPPLIRYLLRNRVLLLKFKEVNDANQHFYELKQCQKNNWIQKMDRVNRPLCLVSGFL